MDPIGSLSVGDDGVGMPKDGGAAVRGLGTSIVESLAKQLRAQVSIIGARPGTTVSVTHTQVAAVDATEVEAHAV